MVECVLFVGMRLESAGSAFRAPIDRAVQSAYRHSHQAGVPVMKRPAQHPMSEDELVGRYAYVLGNVPASVADKAYAAAFTTLSATQRQDLVDELCSRLPGAPKKPASDDPEAFVALMRDLSARDALVRV